MYKYRRQFGYSKLLKEVRYLCGPSGLSSLSRSSFPLRLRLLITYRSEVWSTHEGNQFTNNTEILNSNNRFRVKVWRAEDSYWAYLRLSRPSPAVVCVVVVVVVAAVLIVGITVADSFSLSAPSSDQNLNVNNTLLTSEYMYIFLMQIKN